MLILIIGLIILAGIAMTVGVLHNRQIQKKIESGELKAAPEIVEADAECCGQHEICEKENIKKISLLATTYFSQPCTTGIFQNTI